MILTQGLHLVTQPLVNSVMHVQYVQYVQEFLRNERRREGVPAVIGGGLGGYRMV